VVVVSPAFAGSINVNPDDAFIRMQTHLPGMTVEYSERNTPELSGGGLDNLSFSGSLQVQADRTESTTSDPFFTMGAYVGFSTGSHAYAVDFTRLAIDLRLINAPAVNSSVVYTISGGVYAGGPGENLVTGVSYSDILDGPFIEDISMELEAESEGEEDPVFILPAFGEYFFGITVDISMAIAPFDLPQPDASLLIEFGGDTPYQGLETQLQLRQLPSPGVAPLFALGAIATRRRRC